MLFFWFFIGAFVAIAVHETGHLICAAIVRIQTRRMTIGVGPLLMRFRCRDTTFELRLLPALGSVAEYPQIMFYRSRRAFMLLGGVLANALAVAVIALLTIAIPSLTSAGDVLGPFVIAQLLLLINLLPFNAKAEGASVGSDGRQLLRLFQLPAVAPTEAGNYYTELVMPHNQGRSLPPFTPASSRCMYQLFRLDRWTNEAARTDFVAALLRELARGKLSTAEQVAVIDALVTHALLFGDATLRPRLDALSQRAVTLAPSTTLYGSRASALVELGRCQEGKALLNDLLTQAGLAPFDRFMTEIHLARAERGLGNETAARRWAEAALRTSETCSSPAVAPMLARMNTELGRA